jgi:hypothetical protein
VPVSQVYISSFTQGRRMISSRLLLGSVLEVNAEIKTIKSMLQSAVNGLSNKTALDASFVQAGLPASTALKTQLYCGAGQYLAQAASSCTMCSVGTYSSVVGLVTSCQSCAVGQFANSSGSTKCSSVTSGYSCFHVLSLVHCACSPVWQGYTSNAYAPDTSCCSFFDFRKCRPCCHWKFKPGGHNWCDCWGCCRCNGNFRIQLEALCQSQAENTRPGQ